MRNKDTGEFELVVGDKQLLSGFFIGVLLLAVVFAMGYVLGQSSPKSAKVAPETAAVPANSVADTRPPAASPAAAPSPEPAPVAPPKAQPVPDPGNANYWQVLAGSPTGADALLQTLKGRGFPVSTRPGPNNLTLVWVGPYTDKETLTRAKKLLEDAGFNKLFRKP